MLKENITRPIPVDLGLPSGTLWSDRNLGAATVMDCGDYYMWGSTEPDTHRQCDWRHVPFNGGFRRPNTDIFETFRKDVCPDGILSDQYDAAHAQLGGKWHMPTKEQFQELLAWTTSDWIEIDGIRGRLFTSKTNGNSIFIPAAGYRYGSSVYDVGSLAYLWSSTLNSSNPYYAYYLYFYSDSCVVGHYYRYYGFCVRPVQTDRETVAV